MDDDVVSAIESFWGLRASQLDGVEVSQGASGRDAVLGGQHLNAIRDLLVRALVQLHVPTFHIHATGPKKNMPGFFRPTKNWDLAITNAEGHVVGLVELKSQVGSFGRNANNRAEEAMGNPVDVSAAFEHGLIPVKPWMAYVFVIEDAEGSRAPSSRHHATAYPRDSVFGSASYLERIGILAERAIEVGLYDAAWVIATGQPGTDSPIWSELSESVGWGAFRAALREFVQSQSFTRVGP